jgi:hypothetical protein
MLAGMMIESKSPLFEKLGVERRGRAGCGRSGINPMRHLHTALGEMKTRAPTTVTTAR